MPKYLHMGEEDKTRVNLGDFTNKKELLHMTIWRTEDHVFTSPPSLQDHKINSLTVLMKIQISPFIVLSSTGGASQHQGSCLGQYCYHEDKGCYVQTSTEVRVGHEKY